MPPSGLRRPVHRRFRGRPVRFEILPRVGHFVTDEAPEAVTRLLLSHLAAQE
ncbi:MAG TPA: hypothetical protein VFO08_08170 [Methylomirabilota bacterium]|nr:hypothetical protein [Methylomirabilota bacterium]